MTGGDQPTGNDGGDASPTADGPSGSGEGADTALNALIRKRRLRINSSDALPSEAPEPSPAPRN